MLKKTALILCAAMCLSLAGCSDSEESGTSSTADNHAYDTLSETFLPIFQTYYDGLRDTDYQACFSVFPDFYKNQQGDDLDGQEQEYMDAAKSWFVESYGEDYTVSLALGNIYELTDESITEFEGILSKTFSTTVNLDTAYSVIVKETGKGSLGTNTLESEWYILQIDGKNYMYDTFYEEQEAAQTTTQAITTTSAS